MQWRLLTPKNEALVRSENSLASVGDKLFLLGGRNKLVPEAFDLKTQTWEKRAEAPLEMHHFQAVTFKDEIYVLGALTGPYPHETPIPNIYIYNPKTDKWRTGAEIPDCSPAGFGGSCGLPE